MGVTILNNGNNSIQEIYTNNTHVSKIQWGNDSYLESTKFEELLEQIKKEKVLENKINRKRNWKKPRTKFKHGWYK